MLVCVFVKCIRLLEANVYLKNHDLLEPSFLGIYSLCTVAKELTTSGLALRL